MTNELKRKCDALLANKENLKTVLKWSDHRIEIVCAALYCGANMEADPVRVKACMDMLKEKAGMFSTFRGQTLPIVACMLDIRGGDEIYFDQMLNAYKALRKEFSSCEQLNLAAWILAEKYEESEWNHIVKRAKKLYKEIRAIHPFLTAQDDYVMCTILAMSDKSDEYLIEEMERCYQYLKENFKWGDSNAMQAVSHLLVQCDGAVEMKCQAVIDLYQQIKSEKHTYDKYYGLPMLALLTGLDMSKTMIAKELIEASEYLKPNKGFGNFGLGERTRMTFAAMLMNQVYAGSESGNSHMANGIISMIIAEQIATMACVMICVTSSSIN